MALDRSDADAPPRQNGRPVDPRLLRYASASRWFFLAAGAIGFAQTLVIVAFAWLLTRAITGAIEGMPPAELTATLGSLAVVVAVRAVLSWAREVVASRAAARVQTQLRAHLVSAVDVLGPAWLGAHNTAQLAVTAGRGLDALEAYFGRYLPQLVQTVIATPIIIAVMWWQDWISGLTVVLTIPLIPVFMVLIGLATRSVQQRQWNTLRSLAARFSDTVQGLSTLKVFGRQHRAVASIDRVTDRYRGETMRVLRVSFLSGFALELLASISVAIIAVSIGFRLLDGAMALTVGLFVLLLAPEAYLPIRQVGVQFHAAAEGAAATDDVFAVLDAARAVSATGSATPGASAASATTTDSGERALEVTGLRVRRGDALLPPVSVRVRPGEVVLLEGPSGAGKSSVIAALLGFADHTGDIRFSGGAQGGALRDAMAWSGQRAGLIAGTVADNVTLGASAPDRAMALACLADAQLADIDPDTLLGAGGAGLSGGQAQRVAIARALYRLRTTPAWLLALDEPSSALDDVTEAALWRQIRAAADAGAGVLVISHRVTAREIADAVVRLDAVEVPV